MERLQLAARLQSGAQKTLGCAADLWTLPRVAELIRKDFGHCYSASQASAPVARHGAGAAKSLRGEG